MIFFDQRRDNFEIVVSELVFGTTFEQDINDYWFHLFSGVGAILANSRCTSPAPRRRTTPKPQEPEVNIPGPDNTEMLIMGILRDKKEEKYHEAHNVSNLYHPIHTYVHDFWKIEFETLSSNQGGRTWFLLPV